jgi:isopentenyl-diphosphate delta-isomerase
MYWLRPPEQPYIAAMTDVVLVDEHDNEIGVREKQLAHVDGVLHRALSVFILDPSGRRMLIQQRALDKYHSGGLWSNACCSHPAPGEAVIAAAHRRLSEELGFDCPLDFAFSFTYRAQVSPDLIEHELDHVFIGRCDVAPMADPAEIAAVEWLDIDSVMKDVAARPERYSLWFGIALAELRARHLI